MHEGPGPGCGVHDCGVHEGPGPGCSCTWFSLTAVCMRGEALAAVYMSCRQQTVGRAVAYLLPFMTLRERAVTKKIASPVLFMTLPLVDSAQGHTVASSLLFMILRQWGCAKKQQHWLKGISSIAWQ